MKTIAELTLRRLIRRGFFNRFHFQAVEPWKNDVLETLPKTDMGNTGGHPVSDHGGKTWCTCPVQDWNAPTGPSAAFGGLRHPDLGTGPVHF